MEQTSRLPRFIDERYFSLEERTMKKRKLLLALLAAVLLLAAAIPVQAESYAGVYDFGIVSGASGLNLRAGPSANDA